MELIFLTIYFLSAIMLMIAAYVRIHGDLKDGTTVGGLIMRCVLFAVLGFVPVLNTIIAIVFSVIFIEDSKIWNKKIKIKDKTWVYKY